MFHSHQRSIWPSDMPAEALPKQPAVMTLDAASLREMVASELSEQQKRVLLLLSEGHANKTIAWALGIEEATAKAHVSSILKKIRLTNRTQAALLGLRLRLHADAGDALGVKSADECTLAPCKAVDGHEGLAFTLRLVKLAGGELVEGEGVVRLLREGFLEGALGVGVAAEFLELEPAEELRMRGIEAHFLMPRKVSTSS